MSEHVESPREIEGFSTEVEGGAYPSLEDAIHDAAEKAVELGFGGKPIEIFYIEVTAGNPHITQYRVKGQPV